MIRTVFLAAALAGLVSTSACTTTPIDADGFAKASPNSWKTYTLGKVEGCTVTGSVLSETSRIYSIRCDTPFDQADPIKVFNPAGNCTMKRWRPEPLHNHPKHQYRIWCSGPLKKAEKTAETEPMKIAPNPLHKTYIRRGLNQWEVR